MIDKGKLVTRIKEEYDNLVFQGYSTQEIAYMGTCLIRFALERRIGPGNLKPELEGAIV